MQLLEHALRPLSHPPVQADVVHAVTNGLGALPALAAKWRYGTPMIVTEHGVYMREHYLHLRHPQFGWPVKELYLRFLRRLCTLGYHEAEVITPGNVYNKRWEDRTRRGARPRTHRLQRRGSGRLPGADGGARGPDDLLGGADRPGQGPGDAAARVLPGDQGDAARPGCAYSARRRPGAEAYLERCRAEAAELGLGRAGDLRGPGARDPGRLRGGAYRRPLQHLRRLSLHPDRGDDMRAGLRGHRRRRRQRGDRRRRPGASCRRATRRRWRTPASGCCGTTACGGRWAPPPGRVPWSTSPWTARSARSTRCTQLLGAGSREVADITPRGAGGTGRRREAGTRRPIPVPAEPLDRTAITEDESTCVSASAGLAAARRRIEGSRTVEPISRGHADPARLSRRSAGSRIRTHHDLAQAPPAADRPSRTGRRSCPDDPRAGRVVRSRS